MPIHGEKNIYDANLELVAIFRVLGSISLEVESYHIYLWRNYECAIELTLVITRLIMGVLVLDRCSQGFSNGWGVVLEVMVDEVKTYAWGLVILATLYPDMN